MGGSLSLPAARYPFTLRSAVLHGRCLFSAIRDAPPSSLQSRLRLQQGPVLLLIVPTPDPSDPHEHSHRFPLLPVSSIPRHNGGTSTFLLSFFPAQLVDMAFDLFLFLFLRSWRILVPLLLMMWKEMPIRYPTVSLFLLGARC